MKMKKLTIEDIRPKYPKKNGLRSHVLRPVFASFYKDKNWKNPFGNGTVGGGQIINMLTNQLP